MKSVIYSVTVALLVACADLKQAYEKELASELSPSHATLIVFKLHGSYLEHEVMIDGSPRCALKDYQYCFIRLPPGTYKITSQGWYRDQLQIISLVQSVTANAATVTKIDSTGVVSPFLIFFSLLGLPTPPHLIGWADVTMSVSSMQEFADRWSSLTHAE